MSYLEIWDKEIKYTLRVIVIVFYSVAVLSLSTAMFSRVRAERLYAKAMDYTKKIDKMDDSLLVEKVLFYRKSLNLLDMASRINPKNSKYFFAYAQVLALILQEENSSKISILSDISEIETPPALYNQALNKYSRAINLEPTLAVYHLKLGWIYELLGYFDKAEEEFDKAILLDSTNVINHIYLAKYFLSKNKEVKAFSHACMVRMISRDFTLGQWETAAREFANQFREGNYSQISFRDKDFILRIDKNDLPIDLKSPLGLRVYVRKTALTQEVYALIKYLPDNITIPFGLTLGEEVFDDLIIYELADLSRLADGYAKQKRWRNYQTQLGGVGTKPQGDGIIQKTQLVFNY